MLQNTHTSHNRSWASLLKRAQLFVLSGVILVVPMSAQSFKTANTITGNILGTVVDTSDDPIPGANVILQGPAGDRLTAITKDDGGFAFDQAPAGVAYQITVTASIAACASIGKPLSTRTSLTLPSLPITAISRTVPSRRARPASGGYCGVTSWIRFASATRAATRILFTGVGTGGFARAGTLGAPFSIS